MTVLDDEDLLTQLREEALGHGFSLFGVTRPRPSEHVAF